MEVQQTKPIESYTVWTYFIVLTFVYGLVLSFMQHGAGAVGAITDGLWTIFTSPATLLHDYIAMVGIGPAFINSALAGLLILITFKYIAKSPATGPQMGVFGLVMGFAFLGKNPANMIPILAGAYLFALYKKEPYKNTVTMAGFSTCLAPIVSQPAHVPQFVAALGTAGAVLMGVVLGLIIGFVINAMAVFIRKSHEGLNLYNIGWGAGLLSLGLTMIYNTLGVTPFGPGSANPGGFSIAGVRGVADFYNTELYLFIALTAVFFLAMGLLSGAKFDNLKELTYLKADDNNFYVAHGAGKSYLGMGLLGVLATVLVLVFQVNINAAVLGAIISMVGWGGFGKTVANVLSIGSGVLLAGLLRYVTDARFLADGVGVGSYFSTQAVIWSTLFWGSCLSPMAKYFGWKWGIVVGMMHFFVTYTLAPFHWGQNLYNNGMAAGFVCLIMIPLIRSLDKQGKYPPRAV